MNERDVHQMLGKEPHLELVGADDVADKQVVGSIVPGFSGLFCHGASFLEDDFVGFEKA